MLFNSMFPPTVVLDPPVFTYFVPNKPQDDFLHPLHSSSSFNRSVSHVKHSSKFDLWYFSHVGHVRYLYDVWDIVPIDCQSYSSEGFILLPPSSLETMRHKFGTPFPLSRHRIDSAARRHEVSVAFHLQQVCICTAPGAVILQLSSPCLTVDMLYT